MKQCTNSTYVTEEASQLQHAPPAVRQLTKTVCDYSCPSGRYKPQSFIETKTLRFCNPDTKKTKNKLKHDPKKWNRLAVPFLGPHAQLSKRTKEKHFNGTKIKKPQNCKMHSKGRPLQQTKITNCIYLSKQPA